MIDVAGIRRLLPHRYPMLLVDAVSEVVPGSSLVAVKAVTVNEPCYSALPDGADFSYPPSLLVESWCQAAAVLACLDEPDPDVLTGRVALFGSITDLRFGPAVQPGCLLVHRARLVRLLGEAAVLTGTCEVAGTTVLEVGSVVIAFRTAGQLAPDAGASIPAAAGHSG